MHPIRGLLVVALAGISACDSGTPIGPIDTTPTGSGGHPVTVAVLNGPTPTTAGAYNTAPGTNRSAIVMTPSRVALTLARIGFADGITGEVKQVAAGCVATFNRYLPTFTSIGTCAISVPAGSYDWVYLTFKREVGLFLADTSTGFYTSSTGSNRVNGAPPATAAEFRLNTSADTVVVIKMASKLVVNGTTTPTLTVVIDAHQTVRVSQTSGINSVVVSMPLAFATVGTPSSAEYYVREDLQGAAGFCALYCTFYEGLSALTVLYAGANTPVALGMHYFRTTPVCPLNVTTRVVSDPRSFFGFEPTNGDFGWAVSTDPTWTTYSALLTFRRVTTIGAPTAVYCSNTSTVVAPAGGSFSSAAPGIKATNNGLADFRLIAK